VLKANVASPRSAAHFRAPWGWPTKGRSNASRATFPALSFPSRRVPLRLSFERRAPASERGEHSFSTTGFQFPRHRTSFLQSRRVVKETGLGREEKPRSAPCLGKLRLLKGGATIENGESRLFFSTFPRTVSGYRLLVCPSTTSTSWTTSLEARSSS